MFSHPAINLQKLQEQITERKLNETIADVKDDLEEQAEALLAAIPRTISVEEDKKEARPVLKTMKVPTKRRKKSDLEGN